MAKKNRRKKLEPQTLAEFRAWLSGVEEMQSMEKDGDWTPNSEQWDLIRQRIDHIIEPEQEVVHQPAQPMQPAQPYQPQVPAAPSFMQGHSELDAIPQVPDAPRMPVPEKREHIDTGDRISQPAPLGGDKLPMADQTTEYKSSFL